MKVIALSFFLVLLGCGAAHKAEPDESAPLIDESAHVPAAAADGSGNPNPATATPLPPIDFVPVSQPKYAQGPVAQMAGIAESSGKGLAREHGTHNMWLTCSASPSHPASLQPTDSPFWSWRYRSCCPPRPTPCRSPRENAHSRNTRWWSTNSKSVRD